MCEKCGCGVDSTGSPQEGKPQKNFEQKVKEVIESVRPNLQSHGGDVELVGTDKDNTVKVLLRRACSGCPGARMTIKQGIDGCSKNMCRK